MIKTIAEYKESARPVEDDEWEIFQKEEIAKAHAKSVIPNQVYDSISEIIKRVFEESNNMVFSPTTLYMALAVFAELTAGETKKQIVDALGINEKEIREIYIAVKELTQSTSRLVASKVSSSLWLNEKMDFNRDLLEKLMKYYNVSSYSGEMGANKINDAIANWVNKTTGNLLTKDIKIETTADMLLDFFTTIYFSSKWDNKFNEENTRLGLFNLENGEKVKTKFMKQVVQTQYHEADRFTAITKKLSGGFEVIYILPNEGISVNEVVNDRKAMNLAIEGRLKTTEICDVKLAMPKVDISSKINLISIMKNLGILDAFDEIKADYTPISSLDNLYLNKAEQTTRIKMDEDGVEAASAVEMSLAYLGGISRKYKNVSFSLDRPFLFFISYHGGAPIIAGKIMNPIEERNN